MYVSSIRKPFTLLVRHSVHTFAQRMARNGQTILLVDDNDDDVFLFKRALKEASIPNRVHLCTDLADAADYLHGNEVYADRKKFPAPRMLVLDLKISQRTGLDLLHWLKKHPQCAVIPVVILTDIDDAKVIAEAYRLGANAYFVKPHSGKGMERLLKVICDFWDCAALPPLPSGC